MLFAYKCVVELVVTLLLFVCTTNVFGWPNQRENLSLSFRLLSWVDVTDVVVVVVDVGAPELLLLVEAAGLEVT